MAATRDKVSALGLCTGRENHPSPNSVWLQSTSHSAARSKFNSKQEPLPSPLTGPDPASDIVPDSTSAAIENRPLCLRDRPLWYPNSRPSVRCWLFDINRGRLQLPPSAYLPNHRSGSPIHRVPWLRCLPLRRAANISPSANRYFTKPNCNSHFPILALRPTGLQELRAVSSRCPESRWHHTQ